MKISTKGRYALRMMLDFALHPGECTKIKDVAARQQISEKYLEQIVTILNRAGYVRSVRGAQGGYYLGSLTPQNPGTRMVPYFFVKFKNIILRNSVIYAIIVLTTISCRRKLHYAAHHQQNKQRDLLLRDSFYSA